MRKLVKITLMFLLFAFVFDANASFNVYQGEKKIAKSVAQVKKQAKNEKRSKNKDSRKTIKISGVKNVNYNKLIANHLFGNYATEGN